MTITQNYSCMMRLNSIHKVKISNAFSFWFNRTYLDEQERSTTTVWFCATTISSAQLRTSSKRCITIQSICSTTSNNYTHCKTNDAISMKHSVWLIRIFWLFLFMQVTTVVPIGPHSTHMICPSCLAEIDTRTRREPGLIAYVSGFIIALMG